MIIRPPNDMLSPWFGTRDIDDEASDEAAQIEAAVEPASEGGEIGLGVLGVVEGVKGAGQGGLQVAQHGVDPGELGQIARLALPDNDGRVQAAGVCDGGEARQAIASDLGAGHQGSLGPVAHGLNRTAPGCAAAEVGVVDLDGKRWVLSRWAMVSMILWCMSQAVG